jgi:hypothetical protein
MIVFFDENISYRSELPAAHFTVVLIIGLGENPFWGNKCRRNLFFSMKDPG